MPKVIKVIQSEISRGEGIAGDPARLVVQYHTLKGGFLWEYDHWKEEQATMAELSTVTMIQRGGMPHGPKEGDKANAED